MMNQQEFYIGWQPGASRGFEKCIKRVFKYQGGPLGEEKILDGCITCPWNGYQYLPKNGQSPTPFKEMVSTYDVKVNDGKVWLNPKPYAEGTERSGTMIN